MKTTTSIVVLAITLAAVSVASADEKKAKQEKATTTTTVLQPKAKTNHQYPLHEDTVLTGSYIKQKFRRAGEITDGPNQVLVLDSKTIADSGAADLRQLLVLKGIH